VSVASRDAIVDDHMQRSCHALMFCCRLYRVPGVNLELLLDTPLILKLDYVDLFYSTTVSSSTYKFFPDRLREVSMSLILQDIHFALSLQTYRCSTNWSRVMALTKSPLQQRMPAVIGQHDLGA
jgi:hypothetical protein